ncbi:hypothetical protein A0H81_02857 [Grifola frondosa]|uniref:Uncharacterized protein n=1 Tax=Grifola frondosa TaxID=5627 RepID=A0A1C7MM66_GRIFR|nr:hypothetical protein A0H81_02857 [Grifola frondosa]
MSTTTINLNLHLKRIQKSLAFALAAQDPDDLNFRRRSAKKWKQALPASMAALPATSLCLQPRSTLPLTFPPAVFSQVPDVCGSFCRGRGPPTLRDPAIFLADAQKSGRTIDFKSIREEDGRIAEGWRAAATAETPADVGDLGENRWWEGVAMAGTGATVAGAGAAKRPREVDGGEADASAALAKRTRAAASSNSPPMREDSVAESASSRRKGKDVLRVDPELQSWVESKIASERELPEQEQELPSARERSTEERRMQARIGQEDRGRSYLRLPPAADKSQPASSPSGHARSARSAPNNDSGVPRSIDPNQGQRPRPSASRDRGAVQGEGSLPHLKGCNLALVPGPMRENVGEEDSSSSQDDHAMRHLDFDPDIVEVPPLIRKWTLTLRPFYPTAPPRPFAVTKPMCRKFSKCLLQVLPLGA